jgi:hypothetical protein
VRQAKLDEKNEHANSSSKGCVAESTEEINVGGCAGATGAHTHIHVDIQKESITRKARVPNEFFVHLTNTRKCPLLQTKVGIETDTQLIRVLAQELTKFALEHGSGENCNVQLVEQLGEELVCSDEVLLFHLFGGTLIQPVQENTHQQNI